MSEYKMTVHKIPNLFKPRWWQVRRRYHIWKAHRHREQMLSKMSPEAQLMFDDLQKEIERKMLFGDN
jgi:hypothetical protein